ncbi:MAG TPA: glycosyltransferase family 4 protein [Pirellulales bacterium]|jgi:glycosyltransferase involved in cell wall biosynthesis|nr:glycosyltransferase family 4 protein [Pirellulales bacterium]
MNSWPNPNDDAHDPGLSLEPGAPSRSQAAGTLKVVLVSQEYPPHTARGGIGSQTYLKAHGLAARGHQVVVLSQSIDAGRHEYFDGLIRVVRIPLGNADTPMATEIAQWLTYSSQVAAELDRLCQASRPDLVDFPEWACEGYVYLLNRTAGNYVPVAIHLHGPLVMFAHTMNWPELESDFYRVGTHMERTCLRLADAVFSSSDCSARWCSEHYGLPQQDVPRLHTGVDTRLFRPDHLSASTRPTIVFVGKITRNKGVKLLLEAASRLSEQFSGLRLVIIGQGEREVVAELRAMARRNAVEDMLELRGYVHRDELPSHLCEAHVFAAPSMYEGGPGLVYLEAMACGLPVVACSGSGASEVVEDGQNGFLIPPHDVEALTDVLRRLLTDKQLRKAMGARARRFVVAEGDSQVCLDRLELFYRQVAAGHLKETTIPTEAETAIEAR